MDKFRGTMVVAHPDDEFIFAHNLLTCKVSPQGVPITWTVICMTYTDTMVRGKEFLRSCKYLGVQGKLLGAVDNPFSPLVIANLPVLEKAIQESDFLCTHNPVGEYGHGHHIDTFKAVKAVWETPSESARVPLYVFAQNYTPPDYQYCNIDKLQSPVLTEVYQAQYWTIINFNLITEGFVNYGELPPENRAGVLTI